MAVVVVAAWAFVARGAPELRAPFTPLTLAKPGAACSTIVRLADGALLTADGNSTVVSRDDGATWGERRAILADHPAVAAQQIAGVPGGVVMLVRTRDNVLVAVWRDPRVDDWDKVTGAFGPKADGDVWSVRSLDEGRTWSDKQKLFDGICGHPPINLLQLKNGTIVVPVQYYASYPLRCVIRTYVSADNGKTWRGGNTIDLGGNGHHDGAFEPSLVELRDGRVWMLVRDRQGRLLQSFSADGARWSPLERTPFISSDSPAALLRLRDGKIVLLTNACQNWTDPRSYAMGGREVLHAAISADDGKTWQGFREIFHETDGVSGGDRGTAYPTLAETTDGKIVVVSGQGEGKRAIVTFDPRWLEEREVRDDLAAGPTGWTQYGDTGLRAEPVAGGARAAAIPLKATGLCGALWNFPVAAAGELQARIQLPVAAKAVRLSLTDHFNRSDDRQAAAHAVFAIDPEKIGLAADGRWHDLGLRWSGAAESGELLVTVDGRSAGRWPAQRPAQFGVNYLRVEFRGVADDGDVRIANLTARLLR